MSLSSAPRSAFVPFLSKALVGEQGVVFLVPYGHDLDPPPSPHILFVHTLIGFMPTGSKYFQTCTFIHISLSLPPLPHLFPQHCLPQLTTGTQIYWLSLKAGPFLISGTPLGSLGPKGPSYPDQGPQDPQDPKNLKYSKRPLCQS